MTLFIVSIRSLQIDLILFYSKLSFAHIANEWMEYDSTMEASDRFPAFLIAYRNSSYTNNMDKSIIIKYMKRT